MPRHLSTPKLIIILVIFHILQSMAWYTLFAQPWMEMSGLTHEEAMSVSPLAYGIAMLSAGAAAYMMIWLFPKLYIRDWRLGLKMAAKLGLAFFFLEVMTENMFSLIPFPLTLINAGNFYIYLLVAGILIGKFHNK